MRYAFVLWRSIMAPVFSAFGTRVRFADTEELQVEQFERLLWADRHDLQPSLNTGQDIPAPGQGADV